MINLLPWTLLQLGPFGGMEIILIIIAVAVFLFGTKKIPEMARSLGKATGEFRKGNALSRSCFILGSFDGLVFQWLLEKKGVEWEKVIPDSVDFVLSGLAKK